MAVGDHLKVAAANVRKAADGLRREIADLRRAADEKQREIGLTFANVSRDIQGKQAEMQQVQDDTEKRQKQSEIQGMDRQISQVRINLGKEREQILSDIKAKEGEISGLESQARDLESKAGGPSFL